MESFSSENNISLLGDLDKTAGLHSIFELSDVQEEDVIKNTKKSKYFMRKKQGRRSKQEREDDEDWAQKNITTLRLKKSSSTKEVIKEFRCNLCDFISAYARNLKQHNRTHTGEKPFPCTVCSKRFSESEIQCE
uniref:C2H2-type domain-containing protein n=1 Tax=Clastoptera arizonana TaxID=38151 RepID=A0A1B6DJ56_9HEMI